MRRVQRAGHLHANLQKFVYVHRTARDAVLQRLPFEILHHEEGVALLLTDIVDGADIRMVQGGSSASLAAEALQRLGIARRSLRQKLQRHSPAKPHVLSLVDDSHPAASKFFEDAVMGDGAPDHWSGFRHRPSILRPASDSGNWGGVAGVSGFAIDSAVAHPFVAQARFLAALIAGSGFDFYSPYCAALTETRVHLKFR